MDGRQKKASSQEVLNRMSYLIGHLNANLEMVKQGRYCIDIIRQNQAVISALEKVNEVLLKNHLDTCATTVLRGTNKKERTRVMKEIVEVFNER